MPFVKVTPAMVQKALQETDWAVLDAQTDEDIARQVASDHDAALILDEAETRTSYHPSELPQHMKEAVAQAKVGNEHEHLNDLMEDAELNRICDERKGQRAARVELDDL